MMCPSVWLTLDVLADQQNRNNEGRPAMAQFIDNWLDKLKTNRDAEGGGNKSNNRGCGDEYSLSNVQFARGVNRDGSVNQKDVDKEGKELVLGGDKKRKKKKGKGVRKKEAEFKHLEEEVLKEMKPLVDCSFDLPKSQVGCQRLMGTNVVRLTDKSFMQELRRRIKEDYNAILQKRIAVQEAKEIELERTLAISSRTGCIPQTLAGRQVNLMANMSTHGMSRSRAKLKTNREKNAERLVRQGIRWERERLISYEQEKKKLLEAQKRREEELMVDKTDNSKSQYLRRKTHPPKTQIEDSPATDNKLESIMSQEEEEEDPDQDTDDGESEELVHDNDDQEPINTSQSQEEDGRGIQLDGQEVVTYSATASSNAPEHPSGRLLPGNPINPAIILTGDGIMERLMAAETVDELYHVAEQIIGKTKVKRIKNLLSN